MRLRNRMAGAVTAGLAAVALVLGAAPAGAAGTGASDGLPYAGSTGVGVHNAYEKASTRTSPSAGLGRRHARTRRVDQLLRQLVAGLPRQPSPRLRPGGPPGNDSNCENATSPAQLRTKSRNQNLAGCLSGIRSWHDAHPGHRPVVLKLELKDGFAANSGAVLPSSTRC
ncbi:hypothetical protein [Streptomyces sp. NPDC006463]|uniref:hypothetical protein n=1 Tax=Streptomyces sp. NPDC006463 TaxID=3364746 RepID=UPI0036B4D98D